MTAASIAFFVVINFFYLLLSPTYTYSRSNNISYAVLHDDPELSKNNKQVQSELVSKKDAKLNKREKTKAKMNMYKIINGPLEHFVTLCHLISE